MFLSFYRGVPMYIEEDGVHLVDRYSTEFLFPTEEEAKEYIDEEFRLQGNSIRI